MKKIIWALCAVSILGVLISGYALYLHYKPTDSFCNLSDTFNCDIVNTGQYSTMSGIPVAVFGIIGYLGIAAGSLLVRRFPQLSLFVVLGSAAGLIFALYLTGIEAFVIETYCIVCLASQLAILIAFILAVLLHIKATRRKNISSVN